MKLVSDGFWHPSYSILDVIRQWQDHMDVLEILILMYQKWIWDRANRVRLLWWLNSKESACQCRRHPAGSTHSSTRALRPPEQLERPAGFPSSYCFFLLWLLSNKGTGMIPYDLSFEFILGEEVCLDSGLLRITPSPTRQVPPESHTPRWIQSQRISILRQRDFPQGCYCQCCLPSIPYA